MPPASSVCAFEATLAGTSGLSWMPVKNEAVSAEMSTAPARAVPIEAPSWVPVFCSPPTSPLFSSGTADTVTLPSCEAIAPSPEPASSSGQVMISGPAPTSSRATRSTRPGEQRHEAEVDDPPRRGVRAQLGDAHGEEQQGQRQRQQPHAGLDRRQPERDREEQRDHEEDAGLDQEHEQERDDPAAQLEVAQQRRGRGARPRRGRCAGSPTTGTAPGPRRPPSTIQMTGESPSHSGASGLGWTKPHVPELQDAEHDQAEAGRRQRGADQVELHALLRRRVVHPPGQQQDHERRSAPRRRTPTATRRRW